MSLYHYRAAVQSSRPAETKFRTLVEQLPAITYIQLDDDTGATIYTSPQTEAISGWPAQAFIDTPNHWLSIIHPDDRNGVLAANRRADETGERFRYEYRQRRPAYTYKWIRDESLQVEDPAGGPAYWLGVITDVTELKEAQ